MLHTIIINIVPKRCQAKWLSKDAGNGKAKNCSRFRIMGGKYCNYHTSKRIKEYDEYHLYNQLKEFRKRKGVMTKHRPILMKNLEYCQDCRMTDEQTKAYLCVIERRMREIYTDRYQLGIDIGHLEWQQKLERDFDPYFETVDQRIIWRTKEETDERLALQFGHHQHYGQEKQQQNTEVPRHEEEQQQNTEVPRPEEEEQQQTSTEYEDWNDWSQEKKKKTFKKVIIKLFNRVILCKRKK